MLVNLAVVTNVIPYIVSLSALFVMMRAAKVPDGIYTRNTVITVVAMAYSVFAIYASGKDAVLGGMLVLGIAYIIWGFIAPRFAGRRRQSLHAVREGGLTVPRAIAARRTTMQAQRIEASHACLAFRAIRPCRFLPRARGDARTAQTIDRVKEAGHIRLGYLADARPFSARGAGGAPRATPSRCVSRSPTASRRERGRRSSRSSGCRSRSTTACREVQQGNVDLLCTPTSVTLARRQEVSFSIPIFAGGNRAVLRADAPQALRDALSYSASPHPVWRGSPAAKVIESTKFAVVTGTTTETWLECRRKFLQVDAAHRAGSRLPHRRLQQLAGGQGRRRSSAIASIMLGAQWTMQRDRISRSSTACSRTSGGAWLLAHGDDDFRTLVDRCAEPLYAAERLRGAVREVVRRVRRARRTFFVWNTLPQQLRTRSKAK